MAGVTERAAASVQPGLHGHRIHPGNMLRAGVAEAVGTFFLIYTGTATAAAGALGKSAAGSPPNSLAVALAFGLVLAALVGGLGQVSGAHLNGAVTLGLAVTGKFPWRVTSRPTWPFSRSARSRARAPPGPRLAVWRAVKPTWGCHHPVGWSQ